MIQEPEILETAQHPVSAEGDTTQPEKRKLSENELITLQIAAIAGWTNITVWNPRVTRITYTGTNEKHPELGILVPNYAESLDAITAVFRDLNINYQVSEFDDYCEAEAVHKNIYKFEATPSLALCKLLIAIMSDLESTNNQNT